MYQNVTLFCMANSEFLKIEITTTSNNTKSYGKLFLILKSVLNSVYGTGGLLVPLEEWCQRNLGDTQVHFRRWQ